MSHSIISPAILYWGTPVVLVSSENEDASSNVCAISSAFWLSHRCVLGFGARSKTPQNILRTGHCTVNLPDDSPHLVAAVNALATTTGTAEPSPAKLSRGYRYVKDKWSVASLTPQAYDFVRPPRIQECPVQMECELAARHPLMEDLPDLAGALVLVELKVLRVHVRETLRMKGYPNRIDPDKWRPMIMSFQELYGLGQGKLGFSQLAEIDEEKYRVFSRSKVVQLPGDDDAELVDKENGRLRDTKTTRNGN